MTQAERDGLAIDSGHEKGQEEVDHPAGGSGGSGDQRGLPSNRKISADTEQEAVAILRSPVYRGFGPTLAAEYLNNKHDLEVGRQTVRQWMMAAQLWRAHRSAWRKVHAWRPRRSRFGDWAPTPRHYLCLSLSLDKQGHPPYPGNEDSQVEDIRADRSPSTPIRGLSFKPRKKPNDGNRRWPRTGRSYSMNVWMLVRRSILQSSPVAFGLGLSAAGGVRAGRKLRDPFARSDHEFFQASGDLSIRCVFAD
jgi:hypothetical protein